MLARRLSILLVLAVILLGLPLAGSVAYGHAAAKKKTCKIVTKTVKSKKKRVRVCTTTTVVTVVLPTATSTRVPPTPTSTPVSSSKSTPTSILPATATATATRTVPAIPTSTPVRSDCATLQDCQMAFLGLMNEARARSGALPLTFDLTATTGVSGCLGADGHTFAMIQSGSVWYRYPGDNPDNPTNPASFPNDVCGIQDSISAAAENVGATSGHGNELEEIRHIYGTWLNAGPNNIDACSRLVTPNFACNMIDPHFTRAAISIVSAPFGGTTPGYWVTVHFLN